MYIIVAVLLLISVCYGFSIKSNYPLPKNNIKQIYQKTGDIKLIISMLEKTKDFERIEYKDGKLFLWRKPVIRKIFLKGNKSFWEREITGVAGIIEKHSLDIESVKKIPLRIKQFYLDNGYLNASIDLSITINLEGFADVYIYINEGKQFKLNNIRFLSDVEIEKKNEKTFKKIIDLKRGSVLRYQLVLERLEKLSDYLKEIGYYENIVSLQSIKTIKKDKADLYVNISFGTKYTVVFEGLKSFKEEKLKKLLTFVDSGVSVYQINKTRENIKNFLIQKGFLDSDVDISLVQKSDFESLIRIKVFEGNRYILKEIKGFSKLNSLVGKPYSREKVKDILDRYINQLIESGFLTAKYRIFENIDRKNKTVSLSIEIIRGKKFVLEKIRIKNFSIKYSVKLPVPYNGKILLDLQEEFRKNLKDMGYFDGKVLLDVNIKDMKKYYSVEGVFTFFPGERYKNGITLIYGTYHLSPKVVLVNLSDSKYFKKSDFDLDLINLYSTYMFDYINPITKVDAEKKEVDKLIFLHEDKRGLFQGSVGYNTDRQFRVQASLILKNLFNYGFETFLYTEFTNLGSSIYKYSLGNRFIPKRMTGFMSIYKATEIHRIYDLDTDGFEFSLSKLITRNIKTSLLFRKTSNRIRNETVNIDVREYKAERVSGLINLDFRKPRYDPKSGYIYIFRLEKTFKDIDFFKFETFFRYFFPFKKFVFSQRFGLGYVTEKTENLPISERFFLGGLSTVRGFGYEEIKGIYESGGNTFFFINNDLKYPLYRPLNLYLLTFLDLGNVFVDEEDLKDFYLRQSVGVGVLVPTPVGSIIFDVARKLDRKKGESTYRFELSIGITF